MKKLGVKARLWSKRSWVPIIPFKTIFTPNNSFTWIKAGRNSKLAVCKFCNPANGRVDIKELLTYKTQFYYLAIHFRLKHPVMASALTPIGSVVTLAANWRRPVTRNVQQVRPS